MTLPGRVAIPSFQSNAPNGSSFSSAVFFSAETFFPALLALLFTASLVTGVWLIAEVSVGSVFLASLIFSSAVGMIGEEEILPSGNGSDLITRFSV